MPLKKYFTNGKISKGSPKAEKEEPHKRGLQSTSSHDKHLTHAASKHIEIHCW